MMTSLRHAPPPRRVLATRRGSRFAAQEFAIVATEAYERGYSVASSAWISPCWVGNVYCPLYTYSGVSSTVDSVKPANVCYVVCKLEVAVCV